jgi:RNA polymerase sigma factor (sigma-70 family)
MPVYIFDTFLTNRLTVNGLEPLRDMRATVLHRLVALVLVPGLVAGEVTSHEGRATRPGYFEVSRPSSLIRQSFVFGSGALATISPFVPIPVHNARVLNIREGVSEMARSAAAPAGWESPSKDDIRNLIQQALDREPFDQEELFRALTKIPLERIPGQEEHLTMEALFEAPASHRGPVGQPGTWVTPFSVKRHSLHGLDRFMENFAREKWPEPMTLSLWRLLFLMHDIGKGYTMNEPGTAHQHIYTPQVLWAIREYLPVSDAQFHLMLVLLDNDAIGSHLRDKEGFSLDQAVAMLQKAVKELGMEPREVFRLMTSFYQCDASSYLLENVQETTKIFKRIFGLVPQWDASLGRYKLLFPIEEKFLALERAFLGAQSLPSYVRVPAGHTSDATFIISQVDLLSEEALYEVVETLDELLSEAERTWVAHPEREDPYYMAALDDLFMLAYDRVDYEERESEALAAFIARNLSDQKIVGLLFLTKPDLISGSQPAYTGFYSVDAVAPEFRRQGIGSALLNTSLRWARNQGIMHYAHFVLDGNEKSVQLLRKIAVDYGGYREFRTPDEKGIFYAVDLSQRDLRNFGSQALALPAASIRPSFDDAASRQSAQRGELDRLAAARQLLNEHVLDSLGREIVLAYGQVILTEDQVKQIREMMVLATRRFRSQFGADIEDILQEAVMRALSGLRSFRGNSFSRWLSTRGFNLALNELKQREFLRDHEVPLDEYFTDMDVDYPSSMEPPSDALSQSDLIIYRELVDLGLKDLSPKTVRILTMRYVEGYEAWEISCMLDITKSAVHKRLRRSRQKILAALIKAGVTSVGHTTFRTSTAA